MDYEGGGTCESRLGSGGGSAGGSGAGSGDRPALPQGQPVPAGTPAEYQEIAGACEQGSMISCDLLQLAELADPSLTELTQYGRTCGGRNEPVESCSERYPDNP